MCYLLEVGCCANWLMWTQRQTQIRCHISSGKLTVLHDVHLQIGSTSKQASTVSSLEGRNLVSCGVRTRLGPAGGSLINSLAAIADMHNEGRFMWPLMTAKTSSPPSVYLEEFDGRSNKWSIDLEPAAWAAGPDSLPTIYMSSLVRKDLCAHCCIDQTMKSEGQKKRGRCEGSCSVGRWSSNSSLVGDGREVRLQSLHVVMDS